MFDLKHEGSIGFDVRSNGSLGRFDDISTEFAFHRFGNFIQRNHEGYRHHFGFFTQAGNVRRIQSGIVNRSVLATAFLGDFVQILAGEFIFDIVEFLLTQQNGFHQHHRFGNGHQTFRCCIGVLGNNVAVFDFEAFDISFLGFVVVEPADNGGLVTQTGQIGLETMYFFDRHHNLAGFFGGFDQISRFFGFQLELRRLRIDTVQSFFAGIDFFHQLSQFNHRLFVFAQIVHADNVITEARFDKSQRAFFMSKYIFTERFHHLFKRKIFIGAAFGF